MSDEVRPIDQTVTATLPAESAPAPEAPKPRTLSDFNELSRKAAWESVFGDQAATDDTTTTGTPPPVTPTVAPVVPEPAPAPAPAPVEPLDPIEVASAWIRSDDPNRQKMGWEMLERVKAAATAPQPDVPAQQSTEPNWEERANQIREDLTKRLKAEYTVRKPAVDAIGDEVSGAFVEETLFDENNPLFKEILNLRVKQELTDEINRYHEERRQEEQQRQSAARIRQDHLARVSRAYTTGLILPDKRNTADLFPKAPDGSPDPKAVKRWEKIVLATTSDPDFLKALESHPVHIPDTELSKYVINWAWQEFADIYGLNQAAPAPDAAQSSAPAPSAGPSKPEAGIPGNLLGAANSPNVDNRPATPQAKEGAVDFTKLRTQDPLGPDIRKAAREFVMAQATSGG